MGFVILITSLVLDRGLDEVEEVRKRNGDLLLVAIESQFDSFNVLRREFLQQKREGGGKK